MKQFLKLSLLLSVILVSCSKEQDLNIYQVDITSTDGGTIDGVVSNALEGENITLTAIPSTENYQYYKFLKWEGDIESTENPLALKINQDITLSAVFTLTTYLDDEIYSQIDYNNPYSFLEAFIKDAKRFGVDLSNVDVVNAQIIIDYGLGEGAYSVLPCNPNNVKIVYGGNLWDRRNDDMTNKLWAIGIMWHELGHDILGLDHICPGGHIMSGTHTPCQGEEETEREFKVVWDLRYNSSDPYLNFQRAVEDMFLMVNQYKINCSLNSGKGNSIIYN